MLWLGFLVCTLAILYSGIRLSKYGDIIAEKTGLGRTWIGVVLMASVTSLPELVTGISSVTFSGVPNIAVGDVLGSCVFNLLIIAILDATQKPIPISAKAHHGHVLSAGFGILLLSIVVLGIYLSDRRFAFSLGWLGGYSLIILPCYVAAMKILYVYEKRQLAEFLKEKAAEMKYEKIPMRTAVLNYGINAGVVVIAAVFLPGIGEDIAETSGLGQTFVGNIFIALSTSLPEVVVSVSAVKMDAVDLAIGNLFGSNIFNMFILAVDDILFLRGPILSFSEPAHMISALSAIAMTSIAIIGLTYRSQKKRLVLAWDSIGLVVIYSVNLMLLYLLR